MAHREKGRVPAAHSNPSHDSSISSGEKISINNLDFDISSIRIDSFSTDELGGAKLFATVFKNRFRFVHTNPSNTDLGYWLVWSPEWSEGSRYWYPDERHLVWDCAMQFSEIIRQRALKLRRNANESREAYVERQERYTSWAYRFRNKKALKSLLGLATQQPEMKVIPSDLDQDLWILPTQKQRVDLHTGECRIAQPAQLITRGLSFNLVSSMPIPHWTEFLQGVFGHDPEIISCVQRIVGYSLTTDISEQVIFVLVGNGSNGKSTFVNILTELLGDWVIQTKGSFLMSNSRKFSDYEFELEAARWENARIVIAEESTEGDVLDSALIKRATDPITHARKMYVGPVDFPTRYKLFLVTNHLPKVLDTSYGIWRRPVLIPFQVTFETPEKIRPGDTALPKDPNLMAKLRAELPGILAWAVQGCLAWQKDGLQIPESLQLVTEEYRRNEDSFLEWFDTHCRLWSSEEEKSSDLYNSYRQFVQEQNGHCLTQNRFSRRLKSDYKLTSRHSNGIWMQGVKLVNGNPAVKQLPWELSDQ